MNHGIRGCGHLQGEKQQPLSQIRVPLGNTYYSSVRNCINMQCYCFKNVSLNEHIHGTFLEVFREGKSNQAVRRSPQLPIIWMPPNLLGTFHQ